MSSAGDTIRAAREAAGITQQAIADALGTKRQYVQAIEYGKRVPDNHATISTLADVLGLDTDTLYATFGRIPPEITDHLIGSAADDPSYYHIVRYVLGIIRE